MCKYQANPKSAPRTPQHVDFIACFSLSSSARGGIPEFGIGNVRLIAKSQLHRRLKSAITAKP
jgi:hypothetical protein